NAHLGLEIILVSMPQRRVLLQGLVAALRLVDPAVLQLRCLCPSDGRQPHRYLQFVVRWRFYH
ncbi:MAG: hypothetical protein WCC95_03685, partial [Candidatus Sulfotelmatobacter sp.]